MALELLRSDGAEGEPPYATTGLTTTTDTARRWSFALTTPPPDAYFLAVAPGLAIASPVVFVQAAARVTLSATGASLSGTVTPAQPGRAVRLQRLDHDGKGRLPDGTPRCTGNEGQRVCDERAWITVAEPPLVADRSAFFATVTRSGFYRADLPTSSTSRARPRASTSPSRRSRSRSAVWRPRSGSRWWSARRGASR